MICLHLNYITNFLNKLYIIICYVLAFLMCIGNIFFFYFSGGLSNLLYHVSLPESLTVESKRHDEPKEVLIRVYGQTHGEGALEALITESVIFTLLSERGLGPKLHGIFPGGRIEQYINARPLLTRELADESLSVKIAQKMANIHSMEVRFGMFYFVLRGREVKTIIFIILLYF